MLTKINLEDASIIAFMSVNTEMPAIVVDSKFMPIFRTSEYFFNSNIEDEQEGVMHEGYITDKNGEFTKLVFSMDLQNLQKDEDCKELSESEVIEFLGIPELPEALKDAGQLTGWHRNDFMFLINAENTANLLSV
jgi:hypothetical protein